MEHLTIGAGVFDLKDFTGSVKDFLLRVRELWNQNLGIAVVEEVDEGTVFAFAPGASPANEWILSLMMESEVNRWWRVSRQGGVHVFFVPTEDYCAELNMGAH